MEKRMILLRRGLLAVLLVLWVFAVFGEAHEEVEDAEQQVQVRLDEWRMLLDKQVFHPGRIRFEASNQGRVRHELVVIRTDVPAKDFQVVSGKVQEAAVGEVMGEIEGLSPESEGALSLRLSKGSYVLFCNNLQEGEVEGHYQKGMWAHFTVR